MAANYWDSTQAKHWTFKRTELAAMRAELAHAHQHLHHKYPLPDHRLLSIYFQQNLKNIGRRLQLRQQALATAQIYIKRFYLRVELRKTNPYLIMATAVYLACKMEECPQHIRLMLGEAARQWPELGVTETSKIGECEFALISTLSSRLILHHPYRHLAEWGAPQFGLNADEMALAYSIVNDAYNTDLPLLYPPHIITITAIFLAVVMRPPGGNPSAAAAAAAATPPHAPPLQSPGGQTIHAPPASASNPASAHLHHLHHGPAVSAAAAQNALLGGLSGLRQAAPKLGKLVDWMAEGKVDMHAVVDATQELVSLYQVWEGYNERACKDGITRILAGHNK